MALLNSNFGNLMLGLASYKRPDMLNSVVKMQQEQYNRARQEEEDKRRREMEDYKFSLLKQQQDAQNRAAGLIGMEQRPGVTLPQEQVTQQLAQSLAQMGDINGAISLLQPPAEPEVSGDVKQYMDAMRLGLLPSGTGFREFLTDVKKPLVQIGADKPLPVGDLAKLEDPKGNPIPYGTTAEQASEMGLLPKPEPLPPKLMEDLLSASAMADSFDSMAADYKDGYGGYKAEVVGDLANWATRNLGVGDKSRADWWQRYQEKKNEIRNKFFGSALTNTEKAEFDKAQINPGMTDEQIRINLTRQAEAMRKAQAKLAATAKASGYNVKAIDTATGGGGPVYEIVDGQLVEVK